MNLKSKIFAVLGLCLCAAFFVTVYSQTSQPKETLYKDIKPILDKNCISCHNANRAQDGLRLDNYESIMKGSKHGKVVIPKDDKKSLLMQYIRGEKKPRMPFGKTPLSKADENLIAKWIQDGAKK